MRGKRKISKGTLISEKRVEEAKLLLKLAEEKVGEGEQKLDCKQDVSLKAPEEEINLKVQHEDSSLEPQEDIIILKPRQEDASRKAQVDARLEAQVEDASRKAQEKNAQQKKDAILRAVANDRLEAQVKDTNVEPPPRNIFMSRRKMSRLCDTKCRK